MALHTDLVPLVVTLNTDVRLAVDVDMLAAFAGSASRHSLLVLRSDWSAFDLWCRQEGRMTVPALAQTVADYLVARAKDGAKPASLDRYKASIAKLHHLLGQKDPTVDPLVRMTLRGIRREQGTAQKQAAGLRFKGAVSDLAQEQSRGLNVRALLDSCGADLIGLRDRALLSLAYDTGLRASELVAVQAEHILPATDPEARLLQILRHKGDMEGQGATAFLSPRSVRAVSAWMHAAEIEAGSVFRRVFVRRYKARPAQAGRPLSQWSGRETWDWSKTKPKPAVPARTEFTLGEHALHPASIGPIWRSIIQRAFEAGALPDLTREDLAHVLKTVSAHSTRVGITQDLFASGEDLGGIMDALRWKSPKMPLSYNRNLAAEHGAAGRLMKKLGA